MANHCFSKVSFFGNNEVLEQVEKWNAALVAFSPTKEDPLCLRAIRSVFYPDTTSDETTKLVPTWIYPDSIGTGADNHKLCLGSVRHMPDLLLCHLASNLRKFDKNIVLQNIFFIEDGTYGFQYITTASDSEIYAQGSDINVEWNSCNEHEGPAIDPESLYKEREIKCLTDFILDNPNTINVIQEFMPEFPLDWNQLKIDAVRADAE